MSSLHNAWHVSHANKFDRVNGFRRRWSSTRCFGNSLGWRSDQERQHAAFRTLRCYSAATDVDVDVCIVGGGPAGLATAAAILRARPQTKIKVLESAQQYRPQGASILITHNGWKALDVIDPEIRSRLTPLMSPVSKEAMWKDESGQLLDEDPFGRPKPPPGSQAPATRPAGSSSASGTSTSAPQAALIACWCDVRDALYAALPEGIVEFGSKGTGYSFAEAEGAGDVTSAIVVEYTQSQAERVDGGIIPDQDQQRLSKSMRARVIVGADGFFSKIRAQWRQDGPPDFTGMLQWRGRLLVREGDPDPAGVTSYPSTARLFCNKGQWSGGRSLFVLPSGKDTWSWLAGCPASSLSEFGYCFDSGRPQIRISKADGGPGSLKDAVLAVLAGFPAEALQVVQATPDDLVTQHAVYLRDFSTWPEDKLGNGPLTLVGDAAHTGRADGQGMNQAFEDAVVLAWHLKHEGLTKQALRSFERERLPRVKQIMSLAPSQPERAKLILAFEPKPLV